MRNYIERLEKVCYFLLDSIDGRLDSELYHNKLVQATEEEFGSRALEHIAHWALRECGLDFGVEKNGNGKDDHYVFLKNGRPEKAEIRKALEKYRDIIEIRAAKF